MAPGSAATTVDHGLAPGAPLQLDALAASIVGVLIGALLAVCWCVWMARRGRGATPGAQEQGPPAAERGGGSLRSGSAEAVAPAVQLAVVGILAALLLPAAAALRQLWPHPDLGWPLLAGWAGTLSIVLVAWIILARAAAAGGARS